MDKKKLVEMLNDKILRNTVKAESLARTKRSVMTRREVERRLQTCTDPREAEKLWNALDDLGEAVHDEYLIAHERWIGHCILCLLADLTIKHTVKSNAGPIRPLNDLNDLLDL